MLKRLNKYVLGKQFSQGNQPQRQDSVALKRLGMAYAAIVGSVAQVAAELATHSSIQTAVNQVPSGSTILWLVGTYTENLTLPNGATMKISAQGHGVNLIGDLHLAGQYTELDSCRIQGNISFDNTSIGCWFAGYQAPSFTFQDLGTNNDHRIVVE